MRFARLLLALAFLAAPEACRAALIGHGGPVKAIAVSADGARALTAGFDYSVMLWDLALQRPLLRLVGHDAAVDAVAFLPDGHRAVSAGDDGSLILWDLDTGAVVARWLGHRGKVAALAVSPDGATIASAGWDRSVRLWSVASGTGSVLGEHAANVNAVAFAPDGALLASGDYDGRILLWRLHDADPVVALAGDGFPVNALAFTPEGRLVAASADKLVRVWDVAARRELSRYAGHEEPVVSLALSRDGTLAASASAQGAVDLWRLADGRLERSLYAARGPVWALAFTPDGAMLLSGASDGVVRLWEVRDGRELAGAVPPISPPPEAASRGDRLFRKCRACHALTETDEAKAGPTLYRLFGRRAGSVPGYPYSAALRDSGLVWTPETVDRLFAQGPAAVAPGSKMPLQQMPDAQDRADLIDFLERATAPP